MDSFSDEVHETNTSLNKTRKSLPNEILYDETKEQWKKALEFADVRRLQWQEKRHNPLTGVCYPCQFPITIDEILDLSQLKVVTTGMFK